MRSLRKMHAFLSYHCNIQGGKEHGSTTCLSVMYKRGLRWLSKGMEEPSNTWYKSQIIGCVANTHNPNICPCVYIHNIIIIV